jgi:SNF2 family DNA or RNA helicase
MPSAETSVDENLIIVETFHFGEKDSVKQVPGSKWIRNNMWSVPLSWGSCQALRGIFGDRLVVGDRLEQWARHELDTRINPCNEIRMATQWAEGTQIEADLYPYQDVGVEFLTRCGRGGLFDDMGTGKTIQTIRALRRIANWGRNPFPVCVVSPQSAKQGWANSWAHTTSPEHPVHIKDSCIEGDPRVKTFVVTGTPTQRKKAFKDAKYAIDEGFDVAVIIGWESVRNYSRLAPYGSVSLLEAEKVKKELNELPFRTVVTDEAHRMKDAKSKQTRAVWAVQHGESVEFAFALTGTEIANDAGDLWPIMHGVSPLDYPTKTKYVDRYCQTDWTPYGGLNIVGVKPETREEFFKILDPRMRRMPKSLVLQFLPEKVRQVRYLEMTPKQKKSYKQMSDNMITVTDDGQMIFATSNLTQNTRLLQFSSSCAEINAENMVRLTEPSNKLDELDSILDDLGHKPVVVFAQSSQLIELARIRLEKRGITYRMVTGKTSQHLRQPYVDQFQAGDARVMLMTIGAGKEHFTLTRADTAVFLQRSYSMVENVQAENRVHRIGSQIHDSINIIDMVTQGTVEERQIPRFHMKCARLQEISRDREILLANCAYDAVARLDNEVALINATPLWDGEMTFEGETNDD